MPHIAPIDLSNPGEAADVVAAVKQKIGSVPNIFATMAQSPAALNAYLAFGGALDGASLSAKLREQIALTVAGVNACDYCASAHTFIAKSLGVSAEEAGDNLIGRAADPKTAAILRFAGEAVRNRATFADNAEALDELRSAGVSDTEIVEIVAVIALNIFTNYFNHLAGTEVDFPFVDATASRSAA